jgi:hypothetical protein
LAEFIEFYETITSWPRSERAAFEEHAAELYRASDPVGPRLIRGI